MVYVINVEKHRAESVSAFLLIWQKNRIGTMLCIRVTLQLSGAQWIGHEVADL